MANLSITFIFEQASLRYALGFTGSKGLRVGQCKCDQTRIRDDTDDEIASRIIYQFKDQILTSGFQGV